MSYSIKNVLIFLKFISSLLINGNGLLHLIFTPKWLRNPFDKVLSRTGNLFPKEILGFSCWPLRNPGVFLITLKKSLGFPLAPHEILWYFLYPCSPQGKLVLSVSSKVVSVLPTFTRALFRATQSC